MRTYLVLVAALAACNGNGGTGDPDAGIDAYRGQLPENAACRQLWEKAQDALALSGGSCETPADCATIGGTGSCDCAPFFISGSGRVVAKNAPGYAQASSLEQQYYDDNCDQKDGAPKVCDAAPTNFIQCVDHHCGGNELNSCLPPGPLPDAYIPD